MSFFKKIFQSVLNEEDDAIKKEIVLNEQYKTSKITDKLEKGNNGVFGDEHEEEEEYSQQYKNEEENEEDDDDSDSTNYRDKDKEARRKYIEKIRKQSLLIAQTYAKYKKAKKDSGRKESGRKSGDWGKRTSERNLNREIGGVNRDYAGELRYELAMRSKMRKARAARWEAAKIVIRRRLKRMHINRRFHSNFFRYVLNFKKIKKSLKGLPILINIKAAAKKRSINVGKIKAATKKYVKAKKIEKAKIKLHKRAKEAQEKTTFREMVKARKERRKAEKTLDMYD